MELFPSLTGFYYAVAGDVRIGPLHISIYIALLQQWKLKGAKRSLVFGTEIMKGVKINAGILSLNLRITWLNMAICVITLLQMVAEAARFF